MQITPVNCNHCGASLEIPAGARFVTCRYCSAQLQIHRTPSTVTTEVLQNIDRNTASMAQDLQAIRRESELERLDREWQLRESQLLTRDKHGNTSQPSAIGGIISAIIIIVVGIGGISTFAAFSSTSRSTMSFPGNGPVTFSPAYSRVDSSPDLFSCMIPLIVIVVLGIAIWTGISAITSSNRYEQEHREYLARRNQLLRTPGTSDDPPST